MADEVHSHPQYHDHCCVGALPDSTAALGSIVTRKRFDITLIPFCQIASQEQNMVVAPYLTCECMRLCGSSSETVRVGLLFATALREGAGARQKKGPKRLRRTAARSGWLAVGLYFRFQSAFDAGARF
ncbi:hypothetical protein MRX96_019358 [Rhipicephalus microplus]